MITYVTGDATNPLGSGQKVIIQCVNDIGAMGSGFARAIFKKWPIVRKLYFEWHKNKSGFVLGAVQLIPVRNDIAVANIIGQHGTFNPKRPNNIPVRYEALRAGFEELDKMLPANTSIHSPRIGAGLAGGNWAKIEPIIEETLGHRKVTIYDLPTK